MPRIGTRKLYYILEEELKQLGVGRDKLFSILKANHMQIIPKRSYHITIDSHHRFRKYKNIVAELPIVRPEQVWVSDITYIGNRTNPIYLALVTDAYSKKIVTKRNVKCSMTESYDPYANAVAERVNGILKQEFLGYDRKLNISIMKQLVKDSVRIYNDTRPHYSCHMLTPERMHKQRSIKMRTYKNKNSAENILNAVH